MGHTQSNCNFIMHWNGMPLPCKPIDQSRYTQNLYKIIDMYTKVYPIDWINQRKRSWYIDSTFIYFYGSKGLNCSRQRVQGILELEYIGA